MNSCAKRCLTCIACLLSALCLLACMAWHKPAAASYSAGEIVVEVSSGRVLYENNAALTLPMASTTKILTAIILIEDAELDDIVTIPQGAVGVEGSSVYLTSGEKLTVRDLLYGLMLRSGNDCAVALALYHSGSIEAFAACMNERAAAYGAVNSHFINPHGLPAADHYTTAQDLARITAHALQNDTFQKIVSSRSYTMSDGGNGSRHLCNKNKILQRLEGADGVKTGYTREAGRCLVTSATRGQMQLVSVVLNSPQMYERTQELLEQSFSRYAMHTLLREGEFDVSLPTDVRGKICRCVCTERCRYPLAEEEVGQIRIEADTPKCVVLPVQFGQTVGNLNIYLANQLIFSQKIVSIEGIDKTFLDILREIAQRN